MKALILAGGDLHITPKLKEQLADADLVIAADSGIQHAEALAHMPDLLVGDFDSISKEDAERYDRIEKVKHQPEKDDLDLELAIQEAKSRGATELSLVGVTGSRLDQSLAAIMIAARYKGQFKSVKLFTGKQEVQILQTNDSLQLESSTPTIFSLISLVPESVLSIANAKYPLNHATLAFGTGLGVSNETLASQDLRKTEITIHSGLCVLVVELEN